MIQTIIPKDKDEWLALRSKNLNSTEISALFGISKYSTPYELWQQKKGNYVVEFEGNERTEWGLALEEAIANKVAKDQGVTIRRMSEYIFDDSLRLGASFDFAIETIEIPSSDGNRTYMFENGILEIKNVDGLMFKQEWSEDENGNIEAPPWIECQVQQQLLVSGRSFAWIAALIGGNRLIIIKREPVPSIQDAIKEKAFLFWKSIDENNPPEPNFETDASFINKFYGYAEPGKIIDVTENARIKELAEQYKQIASITKENDARQESIKAEILMMLGDCEKAISPAFSISAGMVGAAHIEYDRKPYRTFKINFKKAK